MMSTKVFQMALLVAAVMLPLACVDDSYYNHTEEEIQATREQSRAGSLRLNLIDNITGNPATKCDYNTYRFSFDQKKVEYRHPVMVSREGWSESSSGIHEFKLAEGFWILGIRADGYRPQETEAFEIKFDKTTELTLRVRPPNRLRIAVFEEDGSRCLNGKLKLYTSDTKRIVTIKDGIAETNVNQDRVTIAVDPRWMRGYRPQSVGVDLKLDRLNEVNIKLKRK